MRLYEFEGKALLSKYNITVPFSTLVSSPESIQAGRVVKAQVLAGGRKKAGGVIICNSLEETKEAAKSLIGKNILGEEVRHVLVEALIPAEKEYYLSVTFDTNMKKPVFILGNLGGIDVEQKDVVTLPVNPLNGPSKEDLIMLIKNAGFPIEQNELIAKTCINTYRLFSEEDARLVEINPLVEQGGEMIALDAVIELDDDAFFRHKERNYQPRTAAKPLTERERTVQKANDADYRGTVKYIELDGDIGFLAAGGGGSITAMDALISYGGRPANFTEFSGNPSDEKMHLLTRSILSKPGLHGLWIVGAIANFTLMDTTMKGVIAALAEIKPDYPIVVRRSGPREKEGIALLRQAALDYGLDMEINGKEIPLTATAKTIVEKTKNYGNTHR